MSDHPARRLWMSLEALHDVVYFAPEVRAAGVGLGLRGFWMTYFAFRAAPLGPVGPDLVTALFAGFAPTMVAKALPDAWSRVSPAACIEKRVEASAGVLREIGVDEHASRAAVAMLATAITRADRTGRPLFAANATVRLSDDPIAAVWQVATTLREHRGDGHVAAIVSGGISGLEAMLLQVAAGRFPGDEMRAARGWTETDWEAATTGLRARDLVGADRVVALTEAGRALLDRIESRTDDAAWHGALAALGETAIAEVVSVLDASVAAVRACGVLPAFNPTGLPS